MARSLKFRIKKVEGLYHLCSENKGTDQLSGYREADLGLCFRNCKKPVFSRRGSFEMQTANRKRLATTMLFCSNWVPQIMFYEENAKIPSHFHLI